MGEKCSASKTAVDRMNGKFAMQLFFCFCFCVFVACVALTIEKQRCFVEMFTLSSVEPPACGPESVSFYLFFFFIFLFF